MNKRIRALELEIRMERESREYYQRQVARLRKRIDALQAAWRRVHPDDQVFMRRFAESNEDSDLLDVFNQLLYSFGRPGKDGIVFTRLDSWHKV